MPRDDIVDSIAVMSMYCKRKTKAGWQLCLHVEPNAARIPTLIHAAVVLLVEEVGRRLSYFGGKNVAVSFVVSWKVGTKRRSIGCWETHERGQDAFRAISRGARPTSIGGGEHEGVSPIPAGPRQPVSVAPHGDGR